MVRRVAGSWPFVGRTGELARADVIFASGAGVLLLGEAGIGKTALARRLAERAAAGGTAVIQVVGRAVSSGAPFEAFAGVLTGERRADAAGRGSGPGSPAEVTGAEVAARVAATTAGARLLLVVDDADLLDNGSARVLLHLASAGATVVATARSAPLPGLIGRLWRDGHCERIELAGLGDDEAGELLSSAASGCAAMPPSRTTRSAGRGPNTASAGQPRMKPYEPGWELAEAAVLAAGLRMDEAADRAAWAAGIAADNQEWNVAVAGYHDAARYGAAQLVRAPIQEAVAHVDGPLAWCYADHTAALAGHDPAALDEVSRRFEGLGTLLLAAEAAAEAALGHAGAGDLRAARASGQRAAEYRAACEGAVSPWLTGALSAIPLTPRERQIAALAAGGHSDLAIAGRLHISTRTVPTHLAHIYAKLGINRRAEPGQPS